RWVAAALRCAATEIEEGGHGVRIELVCVGDAARGVRADALVSAGREAMLNAAKFAASGGPVSVYAEFGPGEAQVFVRDRGPGFDLEGVAADRRGVRSSILERMTRHGGHADIRPAPGGGTEVELRIDLPGDG
ncbi:MAG: PspC protein, partial [Solirubrobacterales bacterium]|nr:PspC protein [Solirubrobacterales bacterium]